MKKKKDDKWTKSIWVTDVEPHWVTYKWIMNRLIRFKLGDWMDNVIRSTNVNYPIFRSKNRNIKLVYEKKNIMLGR